MDELEALKYIFKHNLSIGEDLITIIFNNRTYEIDIHTMRILNPEIEYSDVYDYILKCETTNIPIQGERSIEIESDRVETIRITEEEFFKWLKDNTKHTAEGDGLSGKSIWLSRKTSDNYE